MTRNLEYEIFLKNRGIAIFGSADLALIFEDALVALKLASAAGIPILGGDVYVRRAGGIIPAYANWHTDRREGESQEAYARRSWEESETYIRQYPKSKEAELLFVLVAGN